MRWCNKGQVHPDKYPAVPVSTSLPKAPGPARRNAPWVVTFLVDFLGSTHVEESYAVDEATAVMRATIIAHVNRHNLLEVRSVTRG